MTYVILGFLKNHPAIAESCKKLGYKGPTEITYSNFLLMVVRASSSEACPVKL